MHHTQASGSGTPSRFVRSSYCPTTLTWSALTRPPRTTTRTGGDLMDRGIEIKDQKPGELIFLGLSNRPGSGNDKTPPRAPGRVLSRYETNLGHGGVGVHWSPGDDDRWIGYYEVRSNDTILGKTAKGTYYFDHSEGWDPKARYEVRTVDSDGNQSPWCGSVAIWR